MAAPSGISAQIGYADEVTPGKAVTPTLFLPLVSESLTDDRERLESEGIIAGQSILGSEQWNGGNITIGGSVQHELYTAGIGKLLKAMFGNVVTTGPDGGGIYTHTFTPGSLTGEAITVQVGLPDTSGTVHPKTAAGAKFSSWEIACAAGEIATFGGDLIAMFMEIGTRQITDGVTSTNTALTSATAVFTQADEGLTVSGTGIAAGTRIASVTNGTTVVLDTATTATATGVTVTIGKPLATATYGSAKPFKFNHAYATIGGVSVDIKSATVSGDNALADDRRFLGRQRIKEPLEQDLRVYDGSFEAEFEGLAMYRRFTAGTEGALVLGFVAGSTSLVITENVRIDGETTTAGGREILTSNIPFKAVVPAGGTMANAVTVVLRSTDATV